MEKNALKLLNLPMVKEAFLYERLGDRVKCLLCERKCVINVMEKGFCKTRMNINSKLYTLVYGNVSALESRPIEVKPFFHYWPGSTALTFSTWSCNFNCPWCQNYSLSRSLPKLDLKYFIQPKKLVNEALKLKNEGLCVSFQEPTLFFESAIECFKLGEAKRLYCCFVSNGYMSIEALKILKESGLTGLKIDVKGDKLVYEKYCGGVDSEIVWRNGKIAKEMGVHVEIVNLIVSGVNDDEASIINVIENHVKNLGVDTPIHFTRYFPAYKFFNPPTKIDILEKAYKLAKSAGIKFPYLGNVPGHPLENTYCPECGFKVMERFMNKLTQCNLTLDNKCPKCKAEIPVKGKVKYSAC
ncbi:radical SAM protein [Candidatus Bathyarchaeota archaeon]|nr:radical SAM protein [Candidatus Bathyarchaeota archaeon]